MIELISEDGEVLIGYSEVEMVLIPQLFNPENQLIIMDQFLNVVID